VALSTQRNIINQPISQALIAPSILSADFANMGRDCREVLELGAEVLHIDVMDGHFVPNLTMGPAMCQWLRAAFPDACLDVHMMVDDPGRFLDDFVAAGIDNYTFHIEAVPEPIALIERIHDAKLTCGLAIKPDTPAADILPFIELVDLVLVMSVHPGFSGQAFIPEVLEKTRQISPLLRENQRLEMDGGLNPETAPASKEAGCDLLVAASAIFGVPDREAAIAALRR
jgi:ribulose-phosphate 3-epimerase